MARRKKNDKQRKKALLRKPKIEQHEPVGAITITIFRLLSSLLAYKSGDIHI